MTDESKSIADHLGDKIYPACNIFSVYTCGSSEQLRKAIAEVQALGVDQATALNLALGAVAGVLAELLHHFDPAQRVELLRAAGEHAIRASLHLDRIADQVDPPAAPGVH